MRIQPSAVGVVCIVFVALACCGRHVAAQDGPRWPGPSDPTTVFVRPQGKIEQQPSRKGEEGFRALYTMNRDGTEVEYLIAAPGMLINSDPQFSNDGNYVVFCAWPRFSATEESRLYVTPLDGPFKGVLRDYGYGIEPAWSPDDRQLAYVVNGGNPIDAQSGVWIMNIDGSRRRWLAQALFPRWSPDGKQLACQVYNANGASLALVDVATGKMRDLLVGTPWVVQKYGGNWSPDGKRIVFVGEFEGRDRLATVDVEPQDDAVRILYTNNDPRVRFIGPPTWSPDGKQIVFAVMDAAGGPRNWWNSFLCSLAADVPSAPLLLEAQPVGNINRAMAFSPDSRKLVFTSER